MNNIELIGGLTLLIPIVLAFFDLSFLVLGATTNDTICRNATRIAAAGSPETAAQRAEMALARERQQTGPLRNLRIVNGYPINQGTSDPNAQGPAGGQVTLRTSVDVQLPVPLEAFVNLRQVTVSSEQTYPYTFVRKSQEAPPN